MSSDKLMARLAAADPARAAVPDEVAAQALLERLLATPRRSSGGEPLRRRRRALVIAIACLVMLLTAAVALAATGVIRFGSPAPPSGALSNPREGLGSLSPGTARLLRVSVADPSGGLPWGMRVLSTTRGVGCIEVGRLLDGQLGVLGEGGAFGDDGEFHQLPPGGLAGGGQCGNLDANGRLFYTVSATAVPASGWTGTGSCRAPLPPGSGYATAPATGICRAAQLRSIYYGLLGPEAVSLTYTLAGRKHVLVPAGPEGAYLIVAPYTGFVRYHGRYVLGGAGAGITPLPWSSPITSISYRNGIVCRIGAIQPGTLHGACIPPGLRLARPPRVTAAEVAAPIHVEVIATPPAGRASVGSSRAIRVSFTARVPVSSASSSYEIVEDTSSPVAVFEATQGDVVAGQTVSWLLPAPRPGVYSGEIVLGLGGAPPYPVYTYAAGPVVGRFEVRVG